MVVVVVIVVVVVAAAVVVIEVEGKKEEEKKEEEKKEKGMEKIKEISGDSNDYAYVEQVLFNLQKVRCSRNAIFPRYNHIFIISLYG